MANFTNPARILLATLGLAAIAGCSNDMDEMRAKIDEMKNRPSRGIEPLPEVKPYETFAYAAADQRSPFEAGVPASVANGIRPDANRPREFLEQFSLDTLRMVGTLKLQGHVYGLVQTRDGLVHRVHPRKAGRHRLAAGNGARADGLVVARNGVPVHVRSGACGESFCRCGT